MAKNSKKFTGVPAKSQEEKRACLENEEGTFLFRLDRVSVLHIKNLLGNA